jgi:hypothetical protein
LKAQDIKMKTKVASPEADFRVWPQGTIHLFCPITVAAKEWVKENIPLEDWQWFGNLGFAVDHRYIGNLVSGAVNDGLTLE